MSASPDTPPTRRRNWRIWRIARRTMLVVSTSVVLLLVAFALPATRNAVLSEGLDRLRSSLPGELTIDHASWPGLLRWKLQGVRWVIDSKEVLRVDEAALDVSPRAITRRDLVVRALRAQVRFVDVGALSAAFTDSTPSAKASSPSEASVPYFRPGAIQGIPSVSVESAVVTADSVSLAPEQLALDLHLVADVDLIQGRTPIAHVAFEGHDGNRQWSVEQLSLAIDPIAKQIDGQARVALAEVGEVVLVLRPRPAGGAESEITLTGFSQPLARFVVTPTMEGSSLTGLDLDGTLVVPPTSELAALPILHATLASVGPLEAVAGTFQLQLRTHPSPSLAAKIALHENTWLSSLNADFATRDGRMEFASQLQLTNARCISAVAPEASLPEPFALGLTVRGNGVPQDLDLDATLRAHMADQHLALAASATVDEDRIEANLSPVHIRLGEDASLAKPSSKTNVIFDVRSQELSVRALVVKATATNGPSDLAATATVDATLARLAGALQWNAQVRATLPGPADFATGSAMPLRVDDLGAVDAIIEANGVVDSLTTRFTASADLSATAWVDSAMVVVDGTPQRWHVSAGLKALDALQLAADGTVEDNALDITAEVDVFADSLLSRFDPPVEETRLALAGKVTLAGTLDAPQVLASLNGELSTDEVDVPSIVAEVEYQDHEMSAHLGLPSGVATSQLQLQTAELAVIAPFENGSPGPYRYDLSASGPEIELRHRGILSTGESIQLESDQLNLELRGQDLALTRPLRLRIESAPTKIHFDQVALEGSLGSIAASRTLGRDRSDAQARVVLDLPDKPSELSMPDNLWPKTVKAELNATTTHALTLSVAVAGMSLDGENPVDITANVGVDSTLRAELRVEDPTQRYLEGKGQVPFDWNALAAGADPTTGPLQLDLVAQNLPVPATWLQDGSRRLARLDADLSATGTVAAPQAHGQARLSFPGWPRVAKWVAGFDADLESTPLGSISGQWHLDRAGLRLVSGDATLPVTPQPVALDSTRSVRITTRSTKLPLREVDELLPADIGMDGAITVDFLAEGPAHDPRLQGGITLDNATASLADGSSLVAGGHLSVDGHARLPRLRGKLVVHQGTLVIPDTPPTLLPTAGTSMLWQAEAAVDSKRVIVATPVASPVIPMDLDVTVDIQSGLWVRGKGLEMEVAGNLRLQRAPSDSLPTITGDLAAVRGRFAFLGHDFTLERGSLAFFGSALTPTLDARLATTVSETRVRVLVAGTAMQPRLALESEPEMTEGDITSLLLFGRPLDQLSDDQLGLVRTRTNEVAKSFGMIAVQNQIRQRLGVDLLQIETGTGGHSGSVLVGKYLAPNVLLKYEQMLQETTAFFVNLEYMLTRHVRVETSYGRRLPSGVEVNWTKDY